MKVCFQRARSAEHKEQRRQSILDAARIVIDRDGWYATSLIAIARQAGVVKSGLYRYFESREDILIHLMLDEVDQVTGKIEANISGPMSVPEIADVLANAFVEHPRLCLLVSRASSVLEQNVTSDTFRHFRQQLDERAERIVAAMLRATSDLSKEDCHKGITMLHVLVAGLWPITNPPAHVQAVLDEQEFSRHPRDFALMVRQSANAMLLGIVAGNKLQAERTLSAAS